jgi:hypothetical protein
MKPAATRRRTRMQPHGWESNLAAYTTSCLRQGQESKRCDARAPGREKSLGIQAPGNQYLPGHNCTILGLASIPRGTRLKAPVHITMMMLVPAQSGPRRINVGRQKAGRSR